jgi:hypothetical protein
VPAIRDRTAETAAVLVLEPIFEADLQPEQYAYRQDRSALDAVKHVHKLINTGHGEIVDADLSGYCGRGFPEARFGESHHRARMAGKRGGGFQRVNHSTAVNLDEIPDAGWLNGIDPSNPGSFGAAGGTPDIAAGNNLICFRKRPCHAIGAEDPLLKRRALAPMEAAETCVA